MAVKPNPDPARITGAMWRLWTEFDAHHPSVQLGGIYANKPGYHGTRAAQSGGDYSIAYAIDRRGPSDKAAAIDLTFPEAQRGDFRAMRLYTARLDAAARAKDPRLYRPDGSRVLRELIGTMDGRQTYAYDLQTRRADNNRDDSHMWHLHLSVTRAYVEDWSILAGVLSVLTDGETESEDDMIGLKEGDEGEGVIAVQALLNRAGYDVRDDGMWGPQTTAALLALRRKDTPSTTGTGKVMTGWALAQLMCAVAAKQGGERGPEGPRGEKGDTGPAAKWPAKVTITGTATPAA